MDSEGNPSHKPLNWIELIDDDLESIPFIKEHLDDGYDRIVFKPFKFETGNIIAYKPNGFKWLIGFWKELK